MKRKIYYITAAALSLLFLILIATTAFSLILSLKQSKNAGIPNDTEPLYIYVNANEEETEMQTSDAAWLIKEHNEKIGIFDSEGRLTQIIDTYVKTLPEADRADLREGFWVKDSRELYSVIEAYSD